MRKPIIRLNRVAKPTLTKVGEYWTCQFRLTAFHTPTGIASTPEQAYSNMWRALRSQFSIELFDGPEETPALPPRHPI